MKKNLFYLFLAFLMVTAVMDCPGVLHAAVVDVSMVNFSFQPDPVTINVGDTVRWTNNVPIQHTEVGIGDEDDAFRCTVDIENSDVGPLGLNIYVAHRGIQKPGQDNYRAYFPLPDLREAGSFQSSTHECLSV